MTSDIDWHDESDSFEQVELDDVAREMAARNKPDLSRIRTWLQPTDYAATSSEYMRHLSSQAPGTGEWIRETSQFDQWHLSPDHGSIWIKAVPGAGKSVVAAAMAGSLSTHEGAPVLYFFFRNIIEKNRTSRSLLRDWLAQLLPSSAILQVSLWEHVDGCVPLESVSNEELWRHLLTALKALPRVYCVVDALDEMDLDNDFLERLNRLSSLKPKSIKLLMTSRPKQYLQQKLKDPQVIHVSLEEELVKRDISVFVRQRAAMLVVHGINLELQKLVRDTVCERSQGLFLYARLMLDQVADVVKSAHHDKDSLRNIILKLPVGLEEMYNNVLAQHAKRSGIDSSIQLFILKVVTHSSRPLRLIEIASALELRLPFMSWSQRKELVRSGCGPLLECMEDETIGVLHHSFTEFLLSTNRSRNTSGDISSFPSIRSSSAHKALVKVCLFTLRCDEVQNIDAFAKYAEDKDGSDAEYRCSSRHTPPELKRIYEKVALMSYAVRNWFYHAQYLTDHTDEELYHELDQFVVPKSSHFRAWHYLYNASASKDQYGRATEKPLARGFTTPLHVAAGFNLFTWATKIVGKQVDLNKRDSHDATAIFWAAREGHTEMVRLLLDAGADPDMDSYRGHKPLHEAASRNHARVAKLLLASGVSPMTGKTRDPGRKCGNAASSIGYHPLQYASQRGHVETVREMAPYATSDDLEEALGDAASGGHALLMRFLLDDAHVSPNCLSARRHGGAQRTSGGKPVLVHAIQSRSPECVKILLERQVNLNVTKKEEDGGDRFLAIRDHKKGVLHYLAQCNPRNDEDNSVQEILGLLLAAGTDIEGRDSDGKTPLLCVIRSYDSCLRLLEAFISAGANAIVRDKDGNTMLHQACTHTYGSKAIARVLKAGISPSLARTSDGKTPLHMLLEKYSFDTDAINMLIENGADVNLPDIDGNTPLHYAYRNSQVKLEVLTLLTDRGAQINAQNKTGQTSLHLTPSLDPRKDERSLESKLHHMLDLGADLEMCDHDGRSALMTAVERHPSLVQMYLELPRPASIDTRNNQGKTLLHALCQVRRSGDIIDVSLFDLLVKFGADPTAVDSSGNTLLHDFAPYFNGSSEDVTFISKLINAGVSVHTINDSRQTAAHLCPMLPHARKKDHNYYHRFIPHRKSFVSCLLDHDSSFDINFQDKEEFTALHNAVRSSVRETFEHVVAGADMSCVTFIGEAPLHIAAKHGDCNTVALLLSRHSHDPAFNIDLVDKFGCTALHYASTSHEPELVRLLIDAGCNIRICNKENKTAFALFMESLPSPHPEPETLKHHLPRKGYRDNRAKFGAIYWAGAIKKLFLAAGETSSASHEFLTKVDWLNKAREGNGYTDHLDLYSRLKDVHEIGMDMLLAHAVNFHTTAPNNWDQGTPVTHLVSSQMTDSVRKIAHLVKLYDEPEFTQNLKTKYMHGIPLPLLQIACKVEKYNMSMVRLLVEDGNVDVNCHCQVFEKDGYRATRKVIPGQTALHVLAKGTSFWHIEALEYLLQRDADPNALDENGSSPLHVASSDHYGRPGFFAPQCCRLLLQHGADPNLADNAGLVPLNKSEKGLDIIEILLKAGASSAAGNKNILVTAIESTSPETVQLYVEHGADPNLPDKSKLDAASCRRNDEIIRYPLLLACIPPTYRGWDKDVTSQVVKLLLDHGARLDHQVNEDECLIHHLFKNAATERLGVLLARPDLDLTIRGPRGQTVLMAALQSRHRHEYVSGYPTLVDTKRLELEYTTAATALMQSDTHGPFIDYLAVDNDGRNLLHYFVHSYPDKSCATLDKKIPPHLLSIPGFKSLVHKKDNNELTPFLEALEVGGTVTLEQFMADFEPDLLDVGPNGNTSLHHIARADLKNFDARKPIIEAYLFLCGSIDARNSAGETPLLAHLTAPGFHRLNRLEKDEKEPDPETLPRVKNLRYLIKLGADVKATKNDGDSALHIVSRLGDSVESRAVFTMLMGEGCDPLRENEGGKTALDVAAAKENSGVLKLFARKKI